MKLANFNALEFNAKYYDYWQLENKMISRELGWVSNGIKYPHSGP